MLGATVRLLVGIGALFTLLFLGMELVPIDPARVVLGPLAGETSVQQLRGELELDKPLPVRLLHAMARAVRGDFGRSFYYRTDAASLVLEGSRATFARAGLGLFMGAPLGFMLALRLGDRRRSTFGVWATAAHASPAFCVAVLVLTVGSRALGVSPLTAPAVFEAVCVLIAALPALGLVGSVVFDRISPRGRRAPYVELLDFLKAPPAGRWRVLFRSQILRASAVALDCIPACLTAVAVSEVLFNLRGIGLLFFRSCDRGDRPVVSAATVLFGVVFLIATELTRWFAGWWDPRMPASPPGISARSVGARPLA